MAARLTWCEKGGSRGWVTTHEVRWDVGKRGSGWVLVIPAGYEFESSVPLLLRWAFDPDDPRYLLSACVHDRLLEQGYRVDFADSQWKDAARSVSAPRVRTAVAYSLMVGRRQLITRGGPQQ